jgi:hypothetical protein
MKLFEGKSPAERNKIIAALVLGAMAVLAIGYSFVLPMIFSGRKTTVNVTASPTPTASPRRNTQTAALPTVEEENFIYTTTPVSYEPGNFYAPDAGRNIFAFYEPPPPTPYSPTPTPAPVVEVPKTPEPTPTPPYLIGYVTPQSVFAGQRTFRLEVNGDKFTPESLIYLNGSQLPTTFISPQKLVADVPSNFISSAGSLMIMVRTPDGGLYSNQVSINVQAPPVPQFRYIGMIARQRFNNDTAYFEEQGKPNNPPISARLNDVIGDSTRGRFRLISISASETVFEDEKLGFKHRLELYRPSPGQTAGNTPGQSPLTNNTIRSPQKGNFNPNSPNLNPSAPIDMTNCPPGIPCNTIPVFQPTPPPQRKDEKDDDDGDGY